MVVSIDHGKVYVFGRDEFSQTTYLYHQGNHFVQFTPVGHAWNSGEFKHTDFGGSVDAKGPLQGGGSDSSPGSSAVGLDSQPEHEQESKSVKEETNQHPAESLSSQKPESSEPQAADPTKVKSSVDYNQGFVLSHEDRMNWQLPEEMIAPAARSESGAKCDALVPLAVLIGRASWQGQLYCPFCRVRNQNRWADKTFRKIGSWIQHCQMSRCMPYRVLNFYQSQYDAHKDKLHSLEHAFAADGWDMHEKSAGRPSEKPRGTVLPSDKAEAFSPRKPTVPVPPTPPRARTRSPVAEVPDRASPSRPSRDAHYVADESDTSMEGDVRPYFQIKVDSTLAKRKTIAMPVLMTAPVNGEQTNDARQGVLTVPIGLGVADLYEMGFRVHEIVNSQAGPQYRRLSHESTIIFVAGDKGRFLLVLRASCNIRLLISEFTGGDEKVPANNRPFSCLMQDKPRGLTSRQAELPPNLRHNSFPVKERTWTGTSAAAATFLQSISLSRLLGLLCLVSFQGQIWDRMGLCFESSQAGVVRQLHTSHYNTRVELHTRVLNTFSRVEIPSMRIRQTLLEDPVEEFRPSDGFSHLRRLSIPETFKYGLHDCSLSGGAADLTNKDIGMLTQRIKASHAGYAPAQIRMVLLCDTKLTKRMLQQSDNKIVFDMFLAATKRLGILPLKPADPKEAPNPLLPLSPT